MSQTCGLRDSRHRAWRRTGDRDGLPLPGCGRLGPGWPAGAVDAIEAATRLPFEEGLGKEAELFQECLFSDQSRALIHVFFGERAVAKVPGIGKDVPIVPIKQAAVVGAGTMGGGITMAYANAGIPVILKEITEEALERGLHTIRKNYAATIAKGRLPPQQRQER